MGWGRNYWVYGASSVAIDPSAWQLLLVSLQNVFADEESFVILFFQSHYGHESPLLESTRTYYGAVKQQ